MVMIMRILMMMVLQLRRRGVIELMDADDTL
jgi:hypothetical protein